MLRKALFRCSLVVVALACALTVFDFVSRDAGAGPLPFTQEQARQLGFFNYGSGEEGNVTISVDTTLATATFYNNLTVNAGHKITPAGTSALVISAKSSITVAGEISANGSAGQNAPGGSMQNGGAGGAGGGGGLGVTGGAGGNGGGGNSPGHVGVQPLPGSSTAGNVTMVRGAPAGSPPSFACGAGGAGGADASEAGGAGYSGNGLLTQYSSFHGWISEIFDSAQVTIAPQLVGSAFPVAGQGGGGGGGGGTYAGAGAGGGGGGGGGGVVVLDAPSITIQSGGKVAANGGAGGNGGSPTGLNHGAGGGGGGGGSGGLELLITESLTNNGTVQAIAGAGGAGGVHNVAGADGVAGSSGNVGNVWWYQPSTATWTAL